MVSKPSQSDEALFAAFIEGLIGAINGGPSLDP